MSSLELVPMDSLSSLVASPRTSKEKKRIICIICGKHKKSKNVVPLTMVQDTILEMLRSHFPNLNTSGYICHNDLDSFHSRYMDEVIENDTAQYSNLQDEVLQSFQEQNQLEENLGLLFEKKWTVGERISDIIAKFGGSWKFIIAFGLFIFIWCVLNLSIAAGWDPYPFILLNLCLSMLAAIQAPIIMMSQNRQDEKDRAQSEYDYKVNMQSELQIRHLNAKVDHLITNQCRKLLEMQLFMIKSQKQILSKGKKKERFWQAELKHDPLGEFLLQVLYKKTSKNPFLFEDRFSGGDNFLGVLSSVEIIPTAATLGDSFKICYELDFGLQFATLDAVMTGDSRTSIRNCFGEDCLNATGHIESIKMESKDATFSWSNGKLPPRYRWTLSKNLTDKLTEQWRLPVKKLKIEYHPGQFALSYILDSGSTLSLSHVTFFPAPGTGSKLLMGIDIQSEELLPNLEDPKWKELTSCSWTPSQITSRSPIFVPLEMKLEGGHKYLFYVTVGSVLLTGELEGETPSVHFLG